LFGFDPLRRNFLELVLFEGIFAFDWVALRDGRNHVAVADIRAFRMHQLA
jgi:hypothetical protein